MTPAHMDFQNGVFDYGDWKNAFFVRENRPVMLNPDRTVAYELNHNDYSKKLDGTASDIYNTATNLNAMSTALLEHFLFKDRNLTGIPNTLGTYKLPDGKEILIPFTKNEFRNSLHTELVKENYTGQVRR